MAYIGTSPSNGVRRRFVYEATASQTSFSGSDENGVTLTYVDSLYLDVYQNGIKLKAGDDYTATTGTTVVLVQGASANDVVEMVAFDVFSVGDTVSAKDGGSFAGNVAMAGTLGVTGVLTANGGAVFNEGGADVDFRVESDTVDHALFVQGSDGAVGIGTNSPASGYKLHISGTGNILGKSQTTSSNSLGGLEVWGNASSYLKMFQFGSAYGGTAFAGLTGNDQAVIEAQAVSSLVIATNGGTPDIVFAPNRSAKLTIKNDGRGLSDFTIRAWINFNGTGTIAIRDSHNVSSIQDGATGDYIVNFANNMPSTGYATGLGIGGAAVLIASGRGGQSYNAVGSYRIGVRDGTTEAWTDTELVTAMWCGG